jgi:hypothetical protein
MKIKAEINQKWSPIYSIFIRITRKRKDHLLGKKEVNYLKDCKLKS